MTDILDDLRARTIPPARVLLVEDDDLLRSTTAETLEDAGFEVIAASSGDMAVEMLAKTPVDIVVTDHRMPGEIDGLRLARLVAERLQDVPVLLVTGALPADAPGSPGIVWPAIQKPFRAPELVARINASLADLKGPPRAEGLGTVASR